MFERETEKIAAVASERTIGSRSAVAIKDILAAEIPHPLKTFFRTDVESMLLSEISSGRKGSTFEYGHPEVEKLQGQINSILIPRYTFQREDFLKRLGDAIHLMVNYLIRPQWTLVSVIFERDDVISAPTLLSMLKYFGPYEYIRDISKEYVQEKSAENFSRAEFTKLVRDIDRANVRRKSGSELARVLSPVYDFFEFPEKSPEFAIPSKALSLFFNDKGLGDVADNFQSDRAFTRRDLSDILEDIRRKHGAFEPAERVQPGRAAIGLAVGADDTVLTSRKP